MAELVITLRTWVITVNSPRNVEVQNITVITLLKPTFYPVTTGWWEVISVRFNGRIGYNIANLSNNSKLARKVEVQNITVITLLKPTFYPVTTGWWEVISVIMNGWTGYNIANLSNNSKLPAKCWSPKYYCYHPVETNILPSYNRVMRSNIGKV